MNKLASLILLAALTLTGCVGLPALPGNNELPPTTPTPVAPTAPPPIVLPEQVNAQNKATMVQALKVEIDYDAHK